MVFAAGLPGTPSQLTQLPLRFGDGRSAGVDDVRFAVGNTLLVVDNTANTIYRVTGPFPDGQAYGSLDTVDKKSNTTQVDAVNLFDGERAPFLTGLGTSKGLLFLTGVLAGS